MIEFALVFPVLCALLFGIIDGGRFIGSRVMLGQATAEATRTACLSSTTSGTAVDASLSGNAAAMPGVNIDWTNTSCNGAACAAWPRAANDVVFVTAQYNFQAVFFRSWFSKNITQKSRMVCE